MCLLAVCDLRCYRLNLLMFTRGHLLNLTLLISQREAHVAAMPETRSQPYRADSEDPIHAKTGVSCRC